MYERIPIDNIFIEIYKAFPCSVMGRDDIELSNSIILPQTALQKLSSMKNFGDSKNPILFRILNIEINIFTHCGVAEFTAEEGTCYIPYNMFERLCLTEGQTVNIRNIELKPGTFIKLKPHLTEFINNPNPKTILEYNLRNYFCVTEGDTISVKFGKKVYKIDKMMTQLLNITDFKNRIKGIVLGEFLDIDNDNWLKEIFTEISHELNIPIVGATAIARLLLRP